MKLALYSLATLLAINTFIFSSSTRAEAQNQDAVIVTATRTAQTADEALAAVTVITREDMQRSQVHSVPELLRDVAGVDVATQGGDGKLTSVFLRGTNSSHVLVLVDGIKVGNATSGSVAWEFLPLDEIERVEIVRGPRSALYGSEAVGGVIQIFTRRGTITTEPRASVTAGSHSFNDTTIGISGTNQGTSYNFSTSHLATHGINATQPAIGFDEPDRDGYRNDAYSLRLDQRLAEHVELGINGLRASGHTEYDSFPGSNNEDHFTQEIAGAKLRFEPLQEWVSTVALGNSLDDRNSYRADGPYTPEQFKTTRRSASWQNDVSIGTQQLVTLGYDYYDDQVTSTTTYTRTSRENHGVFGQYQLGFGAQDVNLGYRRDHNEQFGDHDTGNLAWGLELAKNLRLYASYGTAFHAPTFNDLYYSSPFFQGNPNLQPEESKSSELGLKGKNGELGWRMSAYRTDISNLIAYDAATNTVQNVNKARIDGIEAEANTVLNNWRLNGAITLTSPHDVGTGNLLARRSSRTAHLSIDRRMGDFDVGLETIAEGRRYDDASNTVPIAGYGLINLRARYYLARDWQIQGRIENTLDKDYQTVANYNSPGRSYFVGVSYQLQQ
jgi:vitamin B12 transporter